MSGNAGVLVTEDLGNCVFGYLVIWVTGDMGYCVLGIKVES